MKSAKLKSVQRFFHVYLPIAIIVFSIIWIGAMTMDNFHELLHEPIYIIGALVFALTVIVLYWRPK